MSPPRPSRILDIDLLLRMDRAEVGTIILLTYALGKST